MAWVTGLASDSGLVSIAFAHGCVTAMVGVAAAVGDGVSPALTGGADGVVVLLLPPLVPQTPILHPPPPPIPSPQTGTGNYIFLC